MDRNYRNSFTKAYKVLYITNDKYATNNGTEQELPSSKIGYLTEILDSAQEGFPFLWVNSEKYSFTELVLNSGKAMFKTFNELKETLSTFAYTFNADNLTVEEFKN